MNNYIVYNERGAILQTGTCPSEMLGLQKSAGRNVMEGTASIESDYVVGGAITARPTMAAAISAQSIAADGVSAITIGDLPAGVELVIHGPVVTSGITDGSVVELTFALPGSYTIWLSLFPFKNMELIINAT